MGIMPHSREERLAKYEGKTFVFFGQYLYPEKKDGKIVAFVKLLTDNGVDDRSKLDAIRKAVKQ